MKNIFLTPTNQSSRLGYHRNCKLYLHQQSLTENPPNFIPQNIYITSENEDIDIDDYIIRNDGKLVQVDCFLSKHIIGASKVVLTNNPKLISDGVQSISDDFLEWFIDNPTCEFVEVKKRYSDFTVEPFVGYRIIIPQEEPKQETLEEFSKRFANTISTDVYYNPKIAYAINQGGKWQEKIMYSEEEVINAFNEGQALNVRGKLIQGKEWFEQFKKK